MNLRKILLLDDRCQNHIEFNECELDSMILCFYSFN